MSNRRSQLLAQWYPRRDACQWVLGTVYQTHGPCYRKAGAMMLFNSDGEQFGILSGGCLESDIQRHARKVLASGKALTLCYDGSDEDDLSFQLGIGCGGTVHIVLQPLQAEQNYLQLDRLYERLRQRLSSLYLQRIPSGDGQVESRLLSEFEPQVTPTLQSLEEATWLATPIEPEPHLLVVGGGIDARPVVTLAHGLGWQVSVWDPRPANGRREFFMVASHLFSQPAEALPQLISQYSIDAAILMTHNVTLDAQALAQLHGLPLRYLAMLGPVRRRDQVLEQAGLGIDQLTTPLCGPAGLNLGGELPESIALSILAECHAHLEGCDARSLSFMPISA